jgi:hypothetical protein
MMSRYSIHALSIAAALFFAGCTRDDQQMVVRFHDDGRAKPVLSLVPMMDHSNSNVPWNLSDELTSTIAYRLAQKNSIYLVDQETVKSIVRKLTENEHPFRSDLSWVKDAFHGYEFVAFLELVEHDQVISHSLKDEYAGSIFPGDLFMTVRLRVVDLRDTPKVILQEMIHRAHHIPKQFIDTDYTKVSWGKDSYSISPLGLSHSELAKEIASRIEDYLLIAKSN